MRATDSPQTDEALTWKGWIVVSLIAFFAAAGLGLWRPIWITPPYFRFTPILYVALVWSGVVILVVAARHRPAGKRWLPVLGIVINLILSLCMTGLILLIFLFGPTECNKVSTGTIFVRYRCSSQFFYRTDTLTLDGLPVFPLLILTGSSSSTSSFD